MFRRDMKCFDPEYFNLELMKEFKPEVMVLTIWYWIGCSRFIAEKFPRIFNEWDDVSPAGNPYDGQQKLLDYIAKADPERKRMYKKDMLYNILYLLHDMLEVEEKTTP